MTNDAPDQPLAPTAGNDDQLTPQEIIDSMPATRQRWIHAGRRSTDRMRVIDGSDIIQRGGQSQPLFGGHAPVLGYMVQNNSSEVMWISDVGPARPGGSSMRLDPLDRPFVTPQGYGPIDQVNIYGPTTGQVFMARRW